MNPFSLSKYSLLTGKVRRLSSILHMDRYEYSSRDELRVQPLMTTADDGCDQGESSLTHNEEDEAINLDVSQISY